MNFIQKIFLLLFYFLFINSYSAHSSDSIVKLIAKEKDPLKKVLLAEQDILLNGQNYDSSINFYKLHLTDLKATKNKFGENYLHYTIGVVALESANYDDSKDFLAKGITGFIELNNDTMLAKCYMRLGFVHYTLGDYEASTQTYFNALHIAERVNNIKIMAWACNLIGLNFLSKPNPDHKKSLEYLHKAIELNKKDNNYGRNMCLALLRIGAVHIRLKEYEKSEPFLIYSLRIADSIGQNSLKKWSLESYAGLYKARKEYKNSIEIEKRSLELSKLDKEMPGIIISYRNIAENSYLLGDLKTADLYIDSAIALSHQTKIYQTMSSVYILKSSICERKGDLKGSLMYFKRSVEVKDSLFSIETSNNINHLETKYQTQKKEKEITLLNQEKETDKKLKNIYIIALCGAAALICIIIFSLFKISRSKKLIALQKQETEKQKDLVVEKQKDITDSINYALRIQEAILPPREISKDIIDESFILFRQKDIVSGDFYWYNTKNGKKIITAVDCTGHGVPGALMSMLGITFLNEIINHMGITKPSDILSELRDLVKTTLKQKGSEGESKDGMDMALISFDATTLKLEFCGANNPLWIYRPENGSVTFFEIEPDKRPVGYFRGMGIPFTHKEFDLKKGDRIYLFTDGFADQFGGPKGKKFKYKQLQGLLAVIAEEPMNTQCKILAETFDKWKGDLEQVDDVCVIGLKI